MLHVTMHKTQHAKKKRNESARIVQTQTAAQQSQADTHTTSSSNTLSNHLCRDQTLLFDWLCVGTRGVASKNSQAAKK